MSLKMTVKKLLFVICPIILISVIASESEDHYWKSFDGTIPEDAFIGATNFGYNEYIGRGPVNSTGANGLFIGPIVPGSGSIFLATYNQIYTITEHLEILSSNKPCNFKWVPTNSSSVASLPGLMQAGYYFSDFSSFYVGRIKLREQEYAIGHVNQKQDYDFLYLNGSTHSSSSTFEILTYSPYLSP